MDDIKIVIHISPELERHARLDTDHFTKRIFTNELEEIALRARRDITFFHSNVSFVIEKPKIDEKKTITQSEFIKSYCENSGITEERAKELGLFAVPCDCPEEECNGWAMQTRETLKAHVDLYIHDKKNPLN